MSLSNKILAIIAVVIAIFAVAAMTKLGSTENGKDYPVFQKGMSFCTWSKKGYSSSIAEKNLEELAKTGTEYVAIIVTWYQDKYNSTEIKSTHKTPSDESLIQAIRKIHDLGMKAMLKLHLDIKDTSEGKWRGDIDCLSDEVCAEWFKSYEAFLLYYAKIAKDEGVEVLCIGTELSGVTVKYPEHWRKLIKRAKEIYEGRLTYAANWYNEYEEIAFWDDLDYVGIDAYFPLIEKDDPGMDELKEAWKPWVKKIEKWYPKVNKPIVFTEIGYKSSMGSLNLPWEHLPGGPVNLKLQADATQALFETFWDKPWFYGVYWWYWSASSTRAERDRGFTIQNKPAQEVIIEWYKKPTPKR